MQQVVIALTAAALILSGCAALKESRSLHANNERLQTQNDSLERNVEALHSANVRLTREKAALCIWVVEVRGTYGVYIGNGLFMNADGDVERLADSFFDDCTDGIKQYLLNAERRRQLFEEAKKEASEDGDDE